MRRISRLKTLAGLLILGTAGSAIAVNLYISNLDSSVRVDWPDRLVDRMHASCIKEIRQSKARSPIVHRAVCDCQVVEMKNWLLPADVPILLAAKTGGQGLREIVKYAETYSAAEQRAFVERTGQYREASLKSCFRAGIDAALAARDYQ